MQFSSSVAPSLSTPRLHLRGHRADDFVDSAAMWGDPVVTRHIGGVPFSSEQVWSKLLRYVGHWALLGYGYWVVIEQDSGRFVGEVGFADFKRDLDTDFAIAPEIGWALATWSHGKGYATEAVTAVVEWGDRHLGAARTTCLIHPDNAPSIRVAQKCGYRESERATYHGEPTLIFAR